MKERPFTKSVAWIVAVLLFTSLPFATAQARDTRAKDANEKIRALAHEYKELRERRRLLPQGTFDQDLTGHGGRLHEVLSSLGLALGHPPYTRDIIIGYLGKPDAIRNHRQMQGQLEIYNRQLSQAGERIQQHPRRKYLIYFWRGWHDFMFFISDDGVIVDHGWRFAYE